MRNLKRALSLTLASVMLLGMMIVGTSAASFKDADDISNVTAATILQEIGVMVGDGENFMPDQIVTRGQMAIIVCKLLYGDKLNVSQFEGSTQYTDVKVGDYFNGYVNLASSLGIISGYGNGQFGPGDPVTTAQAALMLTKALGYYQNNEITGDWSQDALAAITQATRLTMFEGIQAPAANEGLTRDNVAVMSFNTLTRATPVRFNSILNEYYTVGGSVSTGVEYIDAYEFGKRTDPEYAHTLGFTIYGLYISNNRASDDFNRPADEWSYEKGGIIGTFNAEPVKTFSSKVTSKTLYNVVGKSATDEYDWSVSINGESKAYNGKVDLNKTKSDDNDDFYNEATGENALTGNGVITEVYVDGSKQKVDVVVYDVYAAEVYKVNKDEGTITLTDLIAGPADRDDEFETTAFDEDDVVLYTYANSKIQSVYPATRLDGEVTRVRANTGDTDGDNFSVDGKVYNYNRNMTKDRLTTENVDNNVVAYLDANGYVSYVDESAVTYEYAYVLSAKANDDSYGSNKTVNARLVLTDGTILKVETDAKEADLINSDPSKTTKNMIVSYSANKNNVYALSQKDNDTDNTSGTNGLKGVAASTDIFKNGRAVIKANDDKTYTANSNTIVIVADSDPNPDKYSFTVFTGVKNIPDITAKTTGTKIDVAANSKGIAKVVFVQDADVSGVGSVVYIRAAADAKFVKQSGDNSYYEVSAVVDGKVETLMVKEGSDAAKLLVTNTGSIPGATSKVEVKADKQYIVAAKSITKDSADMVTNVKFYENLDSGDGVAAGVKTGAAKNQVVTLGTASYPWADDVVVARYNVDNGSFSVSSIGSIKDDGNDQWLLVSDDYSLTGVCVVEIKGDGEGSSGGNTQIPGLEVTLDRTTSGVSGKEWTVTKISYSGDRPSEDDILENIIGQIEKAGLEYVDTSYSAGVYTLGFKDTRGTRRFVTWDTSAQTIDKITDVTNGDKLGEALKDSVDIVLDADANLGEGSVANGQTLTVSEGKTLTIDEDTTVGGVINGAGNVVIKGEVANGENIRVDGTITLGENASVTQLGVYSDDPDEAYVADVVLAGADIGANTSVYGSVTVKEDATIDSDSKLTVVELTVAAGKTLTQAGDLQPLVLKFEKGAVWKFGSDDTGWTVATATADLYIDFTTGTINNIPFDKKVGEVELTGLAAAFFTGFGKGLFTVPAAD